MSSLCSVQSEFSLPRSSQQGDGGQAARFTCRHTLVCLLLLFPKNLTPLRALRFSGTPFISAHTYYQMPPLHPFRKPRYRQIGSLFQNSDFGTRISLVYISQNPGKLTRQPNKSFVLRKKFRAPKPERGITCSLRCGKTRCSGSSSNRSTPPLPPKGKVYRIPSAP